MSDDIRENVKNRLAWLRLFFIVIFALVFYVSTFVLGAVVVLQFGFVLLAGRANDNLRRFGRSLGRFLDQIVRYVTFDSDVRPFPFSEWPEAGAPEPGASKQEADKPASQSTARSSSGGRARSAKQGSSKSGTRRSSARTGGK